MNHTTNATKYTLENAPSKEVDSNQDCPDISSEERERILSIIQKMLKMGICAIYGEEDDDISDAYMNCEDNLKWCRAICCTFNFALTKDEVQKGHIKHNPKMPFFIARDDDGYCPHLDRSTLRCTIWQERPLRCRRYICREDPQVSEDKIELLLNRHIEKS